MGAGAGAELVEAAAGRTGRGGGSSSRASPAPVPQRGPRWQAIGLPRVWDMLEVKQILIYVKICEDISRYFKISDLL